MKVLNFQEIEEERYAFFLSLILDSSMVEHSAVNRVVVGSSPTRGVCNLIASRWLLGQVVKTPPFHGGNTGSNPVGVIFMLSVLFTVLMA